MPSDSGRTTSVWMDTAEVPPFGPLEGDAEADVCIVGAGIAGLTTAYLLACEGKSVVVLDDGPIGSGETARTTAHLSNVMDDRFTEIERLHGEQGLRLAAESHSAAIDEIEEIVRREHIDCDFLRLDGYLFLAPGQPADVLDRELAAALRAGMRVDRVDKPPLPGFDAGPALRFLRQGQFHPMKYLGALAQAIVARGGRIHSSTHVDRIDGGKTATVKAGTKTVKAGSVVVATNVPINDLVTMHTKQAPYRTFVIGARLPGGVMAPALFWDTGDPYHYVRLQTTDDGDMLIVGGEDHKTGQADDAPARFDRLEAWARERFPMMGAILYRWSGQVIETIDGLAYLGRNPGDAANVYIATGDSGQGMTHGTIAGLIITDLIAGRENPWTKLYDPARVTLRASGEFASENLNVAAQYADWVTGGDVSSADEIAPGSGAILRSGLSKIAAYREPCGTLHKLSATCTHLGCVVRWNSTEKSWDCPCHGTRYDPLGRVVNGPAVRPLAPVEG